MPSPVPRPSGCWNGRDGGTYPSDEPEQCIDYLLQLRNGVRCEVTDARVLRRFGTGDVSRASDHLPVLLEVRW